LDEPTFVRIKTITRNKRAGQTSTKYAGKTQINEDGNRVTDIHEVRHSPIPTYSTTHEDPIVTCEDCTAKHYVSELEEDFSEDYSVERICPSCKMSDCCELEYETIQQAKDRGVEISKPIEETDA